jgi:hypothetical protein
MALKNSRFVEAEILERREPIPVNHFRDDPGVVELPDEYATAASPPASSG